MAKCILLFVLSLCVVPTLGREFFSSVAHLRDQLTLLKRDKVRPALIEIIAKQEERLNKIKSLAKTLGELSGDEIRDPNFTVHHPLNAFRFIRNHSVIFNTTATEMLQEIRLYEQGRAKIDELSQQIKTFSLDDLKGIIHGILLIQRTYNFTTSDLADGNFGGVKTEPLTATECQDIMIEALKNNYEDIAFEWLEVAFEKLEHGDETTSDILILSKAAAAAASTGDFLKAIPFYRLITDFYPKSRYHRYRLQLYVNQWNIQRFEQNGGNNHTTAHVKTELRQRHDAACQGNVPRLMGSLPKDVYCDYDDNGHPFLLIQPAKREFISMDPYIMVYHDIIRTRTMASLKAWAKPRLRRSMVKAKKGNVPDPQRTSQSYFLRKDIKEVTKLFNVIEALTSLKPKSFENLQVANYGIGGHYYCHHDYFPDDYYNDDTHDNRIATFMLYMSDVEAGGGTIFPDLPEIVLPKMGSAVFWYNMYPNNTLHKDTRHAACPVIVGDKWVGNVWIHRNGNEFEKPCPLDRYSKSWM